MRAIVQDRMGRDLATPLREDEAAWLDADLAEIVDLDAAFPIGEAPASASEQQASQSDGFSCDEAF